MRLIARLTALTAALILVVSCLGDPTGPSTRVGGLALQPRFANAMAAAIVDIRDVRVVLRRPGESRIVVDTVVPFPTSRDTLVLGVEVPLIARTEQMELTLAMTNSLGDTVFRAGPILVTASLDPSDQTPAEPLFTYVGTGANASGVRFVNPPMGVLFGQSVTLAAEAFDAQQTAIVGTPVGFELVNPADSMFAKFTPAGSATLVAGLERATVQVRAVLPGGQSAVHTIAVQPAGAFMTVVSGNQQTGVAGTLLAEPLVAQVFGPDELPVVGEVVEFVLHNSAEQVVFTQRDTSDADGLVSLAVTLPEVAGPHTMIATVVGNVEAAVAYFVEVTAGAGAALQIIDQPATGVAGQPLTPVLEVHVLDALGNLDQAATDPITVALGANPPGDGQLSGTLQVTPVNGVAMFTDLSVQRAAAGYTLVATSGALTSATSAPIEIVAGAPAGLAFVVQPPLAVVMETPFTVVVGAVDAFGNATPTWSGTVTLGFDTNPGAGTLGGTLSGNSVNGTVTFSDLQVDSIGIGYRLSASGSQLVDASSNAFDVNPPPSVNAWINPAGGNWSDGANWSRGIVPTSSDTVWVKLAGTYTVTVDVPITVSRFEMGAAGAQTLAIPAGGGLIVSDEALLTNTVSLEQSGGDIGGTGVLEVAGSYEWNGGNIMGVGTTRVLAGGTMVISGATSSTFIERSIELLGTGTWSASQIINSGVGASLRVASGATLDIQGNPIWQHSMGGVPTVFDVAGVVTHSALAGSTVVPRLLLEGTLNVNSGFLTVMDGSSTAGTLNIAAGAHAFLGGTNHSFGAASTVQGAGDVTVVGGTTVTSAGAWAIADTMNVLGSFSKFGAVGSVGTLVLANSGTRTGAGLLSVGATMVWSGGALTGTGTTRVVSGATLQMSGAASRTMIEHLLDLQGTTIWDDAAPLHTGSGAQVINTGTFTWAGDGAIVHDFGGATPIFENRGVFSRNGTGVARTAAVMVDTVGASWRLDAGDLELLAGGRMGGSFYTGGVLDVRGGTLSMQNGTAWSADGGVVRVSGGIVTVDSGATASFSFLELTGGSLAHEGTIEITGNMQWTGGGIASNTAGEGGRTRLIPGVAMAIEGDAVKTFEGTHVLEIAYDGVSLGGHLVFDGTGDLRAGGGARIENHARVWMQGTGAMLSNLAPPMAVLENTATGSLEATTGALVGTRTMGFALDNLGSIFVSNQSADTLRFTGGSVGNFGGAMSVEVGAVSLDAGTYTLTAPLNVSAPLAITGSALLDLGADTAFVGGNLTLAGGGRIQSTSDLAMLQVDGNASFGGGAGVYSAGRLDIGGNFVQSGPTNSFQATGTHVTRFVGMGAQSIAFSSPGLVTSQFRNLEIANMSATDSVALASNAYVTDSLFVLTGRLGGVSPHRLVVTGDVNLDNPAGSNFVRPFVLEVGGLFTNDVGSIEPDTLVLNRAATYVWDGLTVPNSSHLRFNAGTVTFQATSSPGDLVASGNARIVIPATGNRAVLGNLATQGGGTLQMTVGSDLSVNGDATFAGGGTVSLLSGGRLSVAGDFTQSSANNNASFAPTLAHSTVLNGAGAQTVSFETPTQSQFFRLEVSAPTNRTVTLQSDVTVADSLTMLGGAGVTTLVGAGNSQRLVVGGFLRMSQQTGSPRLAPPVLQLSRRPALDSIFAATSGIHADTVVYVGSALTALPLGRPIHYRSLRISTTNVLPVNSNQGTLAADSIVGDLRILSGGLNIQNVGFSPRGIVVSGDLETSGTGVLAMQTGGQLLTVDGDARFLGGSTAGLLSAGFLKVKGNFEQGGPNATSFQASGAHTVEFAGNVIQNVQMATPGAGASQFATFTVHQQGFTPSRVNLLSDVQALVVADSSEGVTDEIRSTVGALLTAGRASVGNTIFDGVRLSLTDGAAFNYMSFPSFQNIDPTTTFLTINLNVGNVANINGLAFVDQPPNPGLYFALLGGGTLNFTNAIPIDETGLAGRYQRTGTVTWNGVQLPTP
ncbi:MAG TPA: hypothetical protein VFM71_09725 [Gemmatimonadaceae bacterium]|nr:hypothetical protein [Gemmatimonadaceae bacterium]